MRGLVKKVLGNQNNTEVAMMTALGKQVTQRVNTPRLEDRRE
jgi:hypothetical protein